MTDIYDRHRCVKSLERELELAADAVFGRTTAARRVQPLRRIVHRMFGAIPTARGSMRKSSAWQNQMECAHESTRSRHHQSDASTLASSEIREMPVDRGGNGPNVGAWCVLAVSSITASVGLLTAALLLVNKMLKRQPRLGRDMAEKIARQGCARGSCGSVPSMWRKRRDCFDGQKKPETALP